MMRETLTQTQNRPFYNASLYHHHMQSCVPSGRSNSGYVYYNVPWSHKQNSDSPWHQQPWHQTGIYLKHRGQRSTVTRRNERERNRVKHINRTFMTLQQHLPSASKAKKMSKVDTLRNAIQYINHLQTILNCDSNKDTRDEKSNAESQTITTEKSPSQMTDHNSVSRLSCVMTSGNEDDCHSSDQQSKFDSDAFSEGYLMGEDILAGWL